MPELEPRIFSFNSPHGACPRCTGLGAQLEIDPDMLVPDTSVSIADGALVPWSVGNGGFYTAPTIGGTWTQLGATFNPEATGLNNIRAGQARYEAIDSMLSEYAVLGFEYGYSVERADALVRAGREEALAAARTTR